MRSDCPPIRSLATTSTSDQSGPARSAMTIGTQALRHSAVILALMLMAAVSSVHAVDGTLGTTSTGTLDVSYQKSNLVLISQLDDVEFGTASVMSADIRVLERFCVFASSGRFSLIMDTLHGDTSGFRMASGGHLLPYQIYAGAGTNAPEVFPGQFLTNLIGRQTRLDCPGGGNIPMSVGVRASDFNGSPVGSYSDTMTISVFPE